MSSAVGRPPAHKAVWQLSGSQTAAGCAGETLAPIGGAGTVQAMKEWLTPDQVCDQLGICRSSLYALWRAGAGPRYSQIGRLRLVHVDWLRDWLLSCEATA